MAAIGEVKDWYWSDLERHRRGRLNLALARWEVVEITLSKLGFNDVKAAGELSKVYGDEIERHMQPFPGAIDTLNHFRQNNVMLALVTNGESDVQRRKIRRFELEPLFHRIIVESEFGTGKPDRRVFEHALGWLRVDHKDAWMVGYDLARDVAGAKQIGIHSVWVDWQGKGLPASAQLPAQAFFASLSAISASISL
ncbi:MAG: HAD-IA family hydrolase [Dehalococcoidia bacterium]